jgi:LuxR family maltose regulon positive regulatory protein
VSSAVGQRRDDIPLLPHATVERPRLGELLDAGCERPLTLVSAPAGWGKTVLLTYWARARGAAWLTVRSRHADAGVFQADVAAALPRAADPALLVLDDVDRLRGGGLAALRDLIGGHGLRIVVATRADPDLRLGRLRVSGRLAELRAAELAFACAEAGELLTAIGLELRDEQVARLVARTEGWAAGLRLAGLSLVGAPDADAFIAGFAGDDGTVGDYLAGEVLDGQPARTRDFLLRTSVAERLSGALARALTGADDAALTLERLARAGMFLVPLDNRREWYRYHGLFRELLRIRLRLEQPGVERDLHARAARWHAAQGNGGAAVTHALAAGDGGCGDELLAQQWVELLLGGHGGDVVIAASDRCRDDARLNVAAAGACLDRGDAAGADARLGAAARAPGDLGRLAVLMRARARAEPATARVAASRLLALPCPASQLPVRALAHLELGLAEFEHGSPEAAAEQLEAALALAAEHESDSIALACLGRAAALEAASGRLTRAERAAGSAIALAELHGRHRSAAAAWGYLALAAVHWHRDELDDAERRCDAAVTAAHASAEEQALLAGRALRAQLAGARGDVDVGRGLMTAVRESPARPRALVARWLEALGPAMWALPDDGGPIVAAAAWLRRGDPLAALRRLDGLAADDPPAPPAARLHAALLTALATSSLGRLDDASRSLEQALAIAGAEGYRRPFAGDLPLRRLLERQLDRATAYGPLIAELLDALRERDEPPAGLLEPLSERERAVLRLLPTLLSYPEIGVELFVAANTVKTHVKSIFRKLDVANRRDAVARARALRLI